ncbi:hypothetical protein DCAR_0730260 [Daucus carota subsp. sativus]|uniref:CASP-like protein n=1 Tax=Daucus carota subsp. sativus TaxID=79200 RepID=A0A161X9K5_DAUCS|nr:PREDICTED: CASP-like protein 3A1 [Daucus carota subsp. sativus]WOH10788.1 hypothetical protein DCAR_0730260 [Daucus carota subsp. sativus]
MGMDSGIHAKGTAAGMSVQARGICVNVVLRLVCLISTVAALSLMVTAKQDSTISVFGLTVPVRSKWSFSDSFQYLVGVTAAVAFHSLVQLLYNMSMILRKSLVISSRKYLWLLFAVDQVLAYALMSAGSAASGVTNLNRTGIRHSALPNFCKPLSRFCNRVAVSIGLTFFSWLLLATSTVADVVWLFKH